MYLTLSLSLPWKMQRLEVVSCNEMRHLAAVVVPFFLGTFRALVCVQTYLLREARRDNGAGVELVAGIQASFRFSGGALVCIREGSSPPLSTSLFPSSA